jgi:hypothetical protein
MASPIDLTNQRFGHQVALRRADPSEHRERNRRIVHWWVRCDCGAERTVREESLRAGISTRCRKCQARKMHAARRTHGQHASIEYKTWQRMLDRCRNPHNARYPGYGGRGIRVCDRWAQSFEAFYADMGPRPGKGYSLDRVDNDCGYEPGNCRWATIDVQSRNKRDNVMLTFEGRTLCLMDWSREYGINRDTLANRLRVGWPVDLALKTPARDGNRLARLLRERAA